MATTDAGVFNLSSLLNNLDGPGEDNEEKKDLFEFVRTLMQSLATDDPQIYNKAKVMMDEEVQKNFSSFEEAKSTFLARIKEIAGDEHWKKACDECGVEEK
ncbi:unnamed protein product [Cylindrotheca closterium]|uniref:Uncharacterized protein n=1 Tax=Cylindrotheca closterium TaxID=2856 RepID=A0AAD2G5L9_9STRA|nr:unnamed protein product [Cylindrotheca closterium]